MWGSPDPPNVEACGSGAAELSTGVLDGLGSFAGCGVDTIS